jgi:hypothetical protein
LYLNGGKGNFTRSNHLPAMFDNKSCVRPADFDQDGDLDLFVGGRVVGYQYGRSPNSYLLINNGKGHFRDETAKLAPSLRKAGMTTDAQWMDYDKDGDLDLMVAGDWMPIKIYENQNGKLSDVTKGAGLEKTKGLWQTIKSGDFDNDGDLDLLAGNLGTNNKFRKHENSRLKMYVKDVDANGTSDHILTYSRNDQWYPVATKDELGKQMPLINKKFRNYKEYAGKTIADLFDQTQLQDAAELTIDTYQSVYLENLGNKTFKQHALPWEAQVSKIFAFYVADINQDGNLDALLGGNLYGVSSYQGRYDASFGLMLKGNGKGAFTAVLPTKCGFLLENQVRDIKYLKTATGTELMLVARNNLPLQVFKKLAKPANKAQIANNILR